MTIKNCDGTPYQLSGSLDLFDPTSPDHALVSSFDSQLIDIAGSPIFYYEVFIQTHNTLDRLYREDRGKIFSNNPIQLKGYYEPIPSQNFINQFGIDAPDELKIQFNYNDVLKAIGHPPKVGSRIFTPLKSENWVVIQRNAGDFFLYDQLRLTLIVQRFQESVSTGEGRVTQKRPDINLNTGSAIVDNNSNNIKCK
jgi:hypothetical protein